MPKGGRVAAARIALLPESTAERLLSLGAILLLVALITPMLGMSLDHHFADRIPGHGHVSSDQSSGHAHDFRLVHRHGHDVTAGAAAASDQSGPTIAEYDPDLISAGLTLTPATASVLPLPTTASSLRQMRIAHVIYDEQATSPLTPPPRPLD